MKDFFKGVRKHIGKLDANQLRDQYARISDELAFSEMIFHTTSDGYIVLDANGASTWTNPSAERLLGMKVDDILPSFELPLGRASRREVELAYPERRFLEIQTFPMGDETLVKLSDVTATHDRSEDELRAGATEAVRNLASGVAHEIGNPLNAISLNLAILEQELPGNESIAECRGQIERLSGILRGFLNALRPSKPVLRAGSAATPVSACLKTLANEFQQHRISVTLDIPAALPSVALDAAQMEQVYFNLLKNALEAMHDGGHLDITVSSDDNDVRVTLRDNGEGMDPERLATLFQPYRTSKEHGNGLGLMITQRIVRDHGGSIDVESEVGVGTAFTVRLPRIERRVRQLEER